MIIVLPDSAAQILAKLLTVDANDSGLNATTLQGNAPSAFDAAGAASAAVASHVGQSDPHAQYELESANTAAAILTKLLTVDGPNSGLDADLLDSLSSAVFLPRIDTRANILASTPSAAQVAFCSDSLEMAFWNGSAWYFHPLELNAIPNGVDMGLLPPMVQNDRSGYTATAITDKVIHHSTIGANANTVTGGIRVSSGALQIYLNGTWNDVVTGFRFRENSAGGYALEQKPVGFNLWIEVDSGNSASDLGLNGLPLVQGYQISMGAYPAYPRIVGRTITS